MAHVQLVYGSIQWPMCSWYMGTFSGPCAAGIWEHSVAHVQLVYGSIQWPMCSWYMGAFSSPCAAGIWEHSVAMCSWYVRSLVVIRFISKLLPDFISQITSGCSLRPCGCTSMVQVLLKPEALGSTTIFSSYLPVYKWSPFVFTAQTFTCLSGVHQKGCSESVPSLSPLRDSVYCLRTVPGDEQFAVMSEVLKILFNQTVHWREDCDYDDVSSIISISLFVRILNRVL